MLSMLTLALPVHAQGVWAARCEHDMQARQHLVHVVGLAKPVLLRIGLLAWLARAVAGPSCLWLG